MQFADPFALFHDGAANGRPIRWVLQGEAIFQAMADADLTIIVTAQRDAALQERARRAGAFAFFEKPVDDSIITAIGQALKAA